MIRAKVAGLLTALGVVLSPSGAAIAGPATIYATPEHEAKIMALYDAKLAEWGVPYEQLDVQTRYGKTHLIASGPKDGKPVLLIHAMGVTATMWQPTVAALSRDHRVYALDTIGDLGKSQLTSLEDYPKDARGYSVWLSDVMDALHLEQADLVGASMGGWIAMNFAGEMPQRVRRLALLAPMGINASWEVLFRLSWLVMFPTKGNKDGLTRWVLGDNPAVYAAYGEYMNTAMDCRAKLGTPGDLPDERLRKLTMPSLIMFGGKDHPIGDAQKAAQRSRRLIPRATVEILPAAGHVLNTEDPARVNERLSTFLSDEAESPPPSEREEQGIRG